MVMRIRDAEFWRMCTIIVSAMFAMSLVGLVALALTIRENHAGTRWMPGNVLATILPAPQPSTDAPPATPPTLADQVAVAWSVASGWPNSEKWSYILRFTSVEDDLLVATNLTDPVDQSELCTLLSQLNDPVLALDPPIDQVLITGTDGQVIWSCMPTSQVM
jgi:hypothetical protein